MKFNDSQHRPHAEFHGEQPKMRFEDGPYGLRVKLDTWGPRDNVFAAIYNRIDANWGDSPSTVRRDGDLNPEQWARVSAAFKDETLPQVLEMLSFAWTISGVTRACTHQLVRTRLGWAVSQHGGRDNDWRHRNFTVPETIGRTSHALTGEHDCKEEEHALKYPAPLKSGASLRWAAFKQSNPDMANETLLKIVEDYVRDGHELYALMVDLGVPFQDARRVLHIGTQTYLHVDNTYPALSGFLANRLEHIMDWEINCVAQLMLRELKIKCPPLYSKYLGSRSDKQGTAALGGATSWPPDGKHPVAPEHAILNRFHGRLQNPFFVLHPDSMNGGPIKWVPTNGTYPEGLR